MKARREPTPMNEVRRMVVKVGSAIITEKSGRVSRSKASTLVAQLAGARDRGIDVALVSSGAIASGMGKMRITERPRDTEALQALAAVGQGLLINMYSELFEASGVTVGQVLLTQSDMNHRRQYLNARHTLERLFGMGVVPVINENDTVASEEITFGENDLLAALVAALVRADVLVLLTDTGGLHTADPRKYERALLIERVESITDEIEQLAGGAGDELGSGGMSSKVQAAKVAVSAGVPVIIADGRRPRVISDILEGKKVGTRFEAAGGITSRKHWIGYAKEATGRLAVDAGAAHAIAVGGKSLLPAGVVGVEGEFGIGDCVEIIDPLGRVVARGLAGYDASEAKKIMGKRSAQVRDVLGEKGEPIVHRDSLVVFEESSAPASRAPKRTGSSAVRGVRRSR
jgi:glutamate 5-kinase